MQKGDCSSSLLDGPVDEDGLDIRREQSFLTLKTRAHPLLSLICKGDSLICEEVDLGEDLFEADIMELANAAQRNLFDERLQNARGVVCSFVSPR